MAKVGKFCLAKRVKVEWLFHFYAICALATIRLLSML